MVHCIGGGPEDYLTKPFNPILLRARIGVSLEKNLINVQASTGPTGPPVFARTGKTDLPSRLILSQTSSAGKSYRSDYVIAGSSFCAAAVIGGGE